MARVPGDEAAPSRLVDYLSRWSSKIWASLSGRRLLIAILAAHFVLGMLYSVVVPMWEASDETGHFAFVKYLASERHFPPPGQEITKWYDESHQPPLYYLLTAFAISWIDTNDGLEPEINPHAFTGRGMGGVNIAVHSDREAFPYRGTALAMHVARLVSVLISTAVVGVTYLIGRFLFPEDDAIAFGAMGINAFWPQFLFLGSVVTNDVLVPLVSSLVVLFLLRIAYRPARPTDFVGLGLCLLAGVATKMSAWVLVPFALVVLIAIGVRRVSPRARWWVLPVMWFCFSGLWWRFRGLTLPDRWFDGLRYGSTMKSALSFLQHPLRQAIRWHWDTLPHALRYCSRTIWASFGWDNIGVEEWVYQIFTLLCLAGAIGLILFMARRWNHARKFGVVMLAFGVACIFAPSVYRILLGGQRFLYGRIVSSAIPILSLLLFLGLSQLVPRRHTKLLALVTGGSLCALAIIIPFRYIAPAYASPHILSAADVEDIQHPLRVNFGNKIELLGYGLDPEQATTREAMVVTLYWRALSEMEENYTVGVHLVGPDYESYGGRDSYPAGGNYATSLWKRGDIIRDIYWLRVPRRFPTPSVGRVAVTLYLYSSGEHLPVVAPGGEVLGYSAHLGPFGVVAPQAPDYTIQHPVYYTLGDELALVGWDAPHLIGGALPVTLYWQGLSEMPDDYTVFVHVLDEQGRLLGQHDSEPRNGHYPTTMWQEGRIIKDSHAVNLSGALSPGHHTLRLVVGMYLLETMERQPVFDSDGNRLRHDEIVIEHDVQKVSDPPLYLPLIHKQ